MLLALPDPGRDARPLRWLPHAMATDPPTPTPTPRARARVTAQELARLAESLAPEPGWLAMRVRQAREPAR